MAVALFNAEQTGEDVAVFKTTSAGRTWPFLEPWIAQSLLHPLGIAGLCLTWNIDCITTSPGRGVEDFLRDVHAAEEIDRSHPHAPWASIRERLDETAREVFDAVVVRQTYNWDHSIKTRHASPSQRPAMKSIARLAFIDVGLLWNFEVATGDEVAGFVLYDDAHVDSTQADQVLVKVFGLAQRLVKRDALSTTLGQVLERCAPPLELPF